MRRANPHRNPDDGTFDYTPFNKAQITHKATYGNVMNNLPQSIQDVINQKAQSHYAGLVDKHGQDAADQIVGHAIANFGTPLVPAQILTGLALAQMGISL